MAKRPGIRRAMAVTLLAAIVGAVFAQSSPPARPNATAEQLIQQAIEGAGGDIDRADKIVKALKKAPADPEVQWTMLARAADYALKAGQFAEGRKAAAAILAQMAAHSQVDHRQLNALQAEYWRKAYRHAAPGGEKDDAGENLLAALVRLADQAEKEGQYDGAMSLAAEAAPVALATSHPLQENLPVRQKRLEFLKAARIRVDSLIEMSRGAKPPAGLRGEVVQILLVDLDRPQEALTFLNEDVDPFIRTYAPLAAKPLAELQDEACRELGEWYYASLAPKATSFARLAMYDRAQAYYDRFMALHQAADGPRMKVLLMQKDLAVQRQKALAAVDPAAGNARYLCDLAELEAKVGVGTLGKKGDLGNTGGGEKMLKVTVRGKTSDKSLGLHPPKAGAAYVLYRVPPQMTHLKGSVALNDSAAKGAESPVIFEIFGDNRRLWQSPPITRPGVVKPFYVGISGVRALKLQVRCAGGHYYAHAVFLEPALTP